MYELTARYGTGWWLPCVISTDRAIVPLAELVTGAGTHSIHG